MLLAHAVIDHRSRSVSWFEQSVGIDWLTVTTSDPQKGRRLAALGLHLFRQELRAGGLKKPWGMAGFNGYCAGSVQLGEREGECIVRVGSDVARDNWRNLWEFSDSCSRVDFQVTLKYEAAASRIIHNHYRQLKRHNRKLPGQGAVSLYSSSDGSCTIYLGKRSSNRFGRIYDKGAESKLDHWANCVRYEVEFKGKVANLEAGLVYRAENAESYIRARVRQFVTDRGCSFPFASPILASSRWPERRREIPDRLTWLHECVRPTVELLSKSGWGPAVLVALGLVKRSGPSATMPMGHWSNSTRRTKS